MDKLRNDIITIFKIIQTNTECYWYICIDNMWFNESMSLEDNFENPETPSDTELTLFKINFSQILFSYLDKQTSLWRQIFIN